MAVDQQALRALYEILRVLGDIEGDLPDQVDILQVLGRAGYLKGGPIVAELHLLLLLGG